jgi:hypothetical protein
VTKPGVTPSEAYLARLCGKTFLGMWNYPHLYKDQGKKRDGDGKELCDLLVVFGEHLLIFSDKDIELREDADTAIAWSRWYRKAVLDSAGQVFGAERWLREHPDRVFTDPQCARRLPVELPRNPRVHRILTCRGASAACAKALGGFGSLMVTNSKLEECKDTPFQVGTFDAVGVVAQLHETVFHNTSELSPSELVAFKRDQSPAEYSFDEYRRDVELTLAENYGTGAISSENAASWKGWAARDDSDWAGIPTEMDTPFFLGGAHGLSCH